MRMTRIALGVLVSMFVATPLAAQGRPCDDGRGAEMVDFGFDRLPTTSTGGGERMVDGEPRISGVRPDGPAARLLRDGDVLVAIEGESVRTAAASRRYGAARNGEATRLRVRRDGREIDVTITPGVRCVPFPPAPPTPPAAPDAPSVPPPPAPPAGELMPPASLGFTIDCQDCGKEDVNGFPSFRFRRPPTVAAVEAGSAAAQAGVQAGDQLVRVDDVALSGPNGWTRWSSIQPGRTVKLTLARGGRTFDVTLRAR